MTKLPEVKPLRLVRALEKRGFFVARKRGGHLDLWHPDGRKTVVPIHPKPLAKGTLAAILRQTQLSIKELKQLL